MDTQRTLLAGAVAGGCEAAVGDHLAGFTKVSFPSLDRPESPLGLLRAAMGPAAGERSVGAEAWALCKMAVPLSLGNLPTMRATSGSTSASEACSDAPAVGPATLRSRVAVRGTLLRNNCKETEGS